MEFEMCLEEVIEASAKTGGKEGFAVAAGLMAVAISVDRLRRDLREFRGDPRGILEVLSAEIKDGSQGLARAIHEFGNQIERALGETGIAEAISDVGDALNKQET